MRRKRLDRQRGVPRQRLHGFSLARMFRLGPVDRGQSTLEYLGLIAVVVLIIGGLAATMIGTDVSSKIGEQVCRVTGGSDCGGSDSDDAPVASGSDGTGGTGGTGGTSGTGGRGDATQAGSAKSRTQLEYEDTQRELAQANKKYDKYRELLQEAAKSLGKIAADELGITDALKCFQEGDGSACTETALNVALQLVGGMPAKLLKKYGLNPTKWDDAVKLGKQIVKHGKDLYKGTKGMWEAKKKADRLKAKLAALKTKLRNEKKSANGKKTRRANCHSFPPGTTVLLADGSRTAIEDVRLGDWVTVTDPNLGLTTSRPVVDTITTEYDKAFTQLTVVVDGSPTTITATNTHPFWLVDKERWVKAGSIRPGAELRTPSGVALPVTAVSHHSKQRRTHDLTIRDIHSYYIGVGPQNALVHNCDEWTSKGNIDEHYEKHGEEMGYESQIEYEEAAKDLMCDCDDGRPGVIAKDDSSSGTTRYFDPETGEYGMKSKKGIITFYKLDGGLATFNKMPGTKRPRRRRNRREQ
jgi:hypothetical protein